MVILIFCLARNSELDDVVGDRRLAYEECLWLVVALNFVVSSSAMTEQEVHSSITHRFVIMFLTDKSVKTS